jgi:hypothetical protein
MINKKVVMALVMLNLAVLLGWGVKVFTDKRQAQEFERMIADAHPATMEALKVTTRSNVSSAKEIKEKVQRTRSIDDADLQFLIELFRQGPVQKSPENWSSLALEAVVPICYVRTFSSTQEMKVKSFISLLRETSIKEKSYRCELAAVTLLARTNLSFRKEALDEFEKSPEVKVREYVAKAKKFQPGSL